MIRLQVPYSQKDAAKAMGAKWDSEQKTWYVPPGVLLTSFQKWLPVGDATQIDTLAKAVKKTAPKVDAYVGKTVVGAHYFKLDHDCNPFEECEVCGPALEASGWAKARRESLLAAMHRSG